MAQNGSIIKRKIILMISIILVFAICLAVLVGCKSEGKTTLYCDTLEELQTVCPDFYYFDLGENMVAESYGAHLLVRGNVNDIIEARGYSIHYSATEGKAGDHWGIGCSNILKLEWSTSDTTQYTELEEYGIFDFDYKLYYRENISKVDYEDVRIRHGFVLFCIIEEMCYSFTFSEIIIDNETMENLDIEYFLNAVKIAVSSRYKIFGRT